MKVFHSLTNLFIGQGWGKSLRTGTHSPTSVSGTFSMCDQQEPYYLLTFCIIALSVYPFVKDIYLNADNIHATLQTLTSFLSSEHKRHLLLRKFVCNCIQLTCIQGMQLSICLYK